MKAILKREIKGYLKNPIFWFGLLLVTIGIYQSVSSYLDIHYFQSDKEIQSNQVNVITDADITDGYVPSTQEEQMLLASEEIKKILIEQEICSTKEAEAAAGKIKTMTLEEANAYLEKEYGFYGAQYIFEDAKYHQGTVQEVNGYIKEKLQEHSFSYYFGRKFADFLGVHMAFFAAVILSVLYFGDTRRSTYELLHTKAISSGAYIMGKTLGGFFVLLISCGILNLIFTVLCISHEMEAGFTVRMGDVFALAKASCLYVLPNMLRIVCVYTIVAVLFKNPFPAVPLLVLYIIYSNMGSTGPDGTYGYYGRPLAIMVRFPGRFFDTAPPPMAVWNQLFLLAASAAVTVLAVQVWKRRRAC